MRGRDVDGTVLVEPTEGRGFRARAPVEAIAGENAPVMIRLPGVRLCPNGSSDYHLCPGYVLTSRNTVRLGTCLAMVSR